MATCTSDILQRTIRNAYLVQKSLTNLGRLEIILSMNVRKEEIFIPRGSVALQLRNLTICSMKHTKKL